LMVATEKNVCLPNCKLLCKWKQCKLISTLTKPHVATPRPHLLKPWTQEDKNKLLATTSDEIDLKDMVLGVAAEQMAAAITQNIDKLDRNSRNLLLQSLAKFDSTEKYKHKYNNLPFSALPMEHAISTLDLLRVHPWEKYSITNDDMWSLAIGQLSSNWGQPTTRVCLCCSRAPTRGVY